MRRALSSAATSGAIITVVAGIRAVHRALLAAGVARRAPVDRAPAFTELRRLGEELDTHEARNRSLLDQLDHRTAQVRAVSPLVNGSSCDGRSHVTFWPGS